MERSIALGPNDAFAICDGALVGALLGDGPIGRWRLGR